MLQTHPAVNEPADDALIIWRYIDLPRFLSLLTTRSLYLCRADRLGDPLEGTITKATVESYGNPKSPTSIPAFQETLRQLRTSIRRNVAINCWHLRSTESAAMWAKYGAQSSGIAVKSSIDRLRRSLANWSETAYFGCVKYVDFDRTSFGSANLLAPFAHKRLEFEDERELRILISQLPARHHNDAQILDHSVALPEGVYAPVDVEQLIEEVVFAPEMPNWQIESVREVIRALGFTISTRPSSLVRKAILG